MANTYTDRANKYVPTYVIRNMWGEEINHKEDPSKVFDSAVNAFCQDLIDDMFMKAMSIYCGSELLIRCLTKERVEELKKHANEISEILKLHTSDRGVDYLYSPLDDRR